VEDSGGLQWRIVENDLTLQWRTAWPSLAAFWRPTSHGVIVVALTESAAAPPCLFLGRPSIIRALLLQCTTSYICLLGTGCPDRMQFMRPALHNPCPL